MPKMKKPELSKEDFIRIYYLIKQYLEWAYDWKESKDELKDLIAGKG